MEFVVKEGAALGDGKHAGQITRIEYREEPYKYTDVFVREEKTGLELKYGCPTNDSIEGKLMKLLNKFVDVKPGLTLDPEKILIGEDVTFMTMQEEKGDKKFVRIVEGSLKPAVSQETVTDTQQPLGG